MTSPATDRTYARLIGGTKTHIVNSVEGWGIVALCRRFLRDPRVRTGVSPNEDHPLCKRCQVNAGMMPSYTRAELRSMIVNLQERVESLERIIVGGWMKETK